MSIELENVNRLIDQKAYDDAIAQANFYLANHVGLVHEMEFSVVRALVGKKQIANAIAKLVFLTEKNPLREDYHHYLGNLFMRMEWYDKAHKSYKRAIELYPDSYEFFGSLAECCRQLNDYDASFSAYERAIDLVEQHVLINKESKEITPPLIVEGRDLILEITGVGDADDFSLYGLSADKKVGVYIPVGTKASSLTENELKSPQSPLFSLEKSGTQVFDRNRVLDSLSVADIARMELFKQTSFEAIIYRRKGE